MTTKEKLEKGKELYYKSATQIQGIALLKEAMQEGSEDAALVLGMHYLELKAYVAANECFEFGASKGQKDCLWFLAHAYGTPGKGKEVDHIKAYDLMLQAIEKGCEAEEWVVEMFKREAEEQRKKENSLFKRLFGRR